MAGVPAAASGLFTKTPVRSSLLRGLVGGGLGAGLGHYSPQIGQFLWGEGLDKEPVTADGDKPAPQGKAPASKSAPQDKAPASKSAPQDKAPASKSAPQDKATQSPGASRTDAARQRAFRFETRDESPGFEPSNADQYNRERDKVFSFGV